MWIGHRKEIRKLTFRALALHQSESNPIYSLRQRANTRNVSFSIPLRWPIHIINPVDKTQLSRYTSHRRSTTVSLGSYPSTLKFVYLHFISINSCWGLQGPTPHVCQWYQRNRQLMPELVPFHSLHSFLWRPWLAADDLYFWDSRNVFLWWL